MQHLIHSTIIVVYLFVSPLNNENSSFLVFLVADTAPGLE